ncbi:MAG: NAD(P)/FAD-dependent oxidoreductase [Clostridia bacterium]|nr:NAD(P)/FAD-dependent oxidoreductase [Clostridia bacterium]
MKKIVVGGAGHGGLAAALNLAREGYDVTVVESKAPEEMGYDWHDTMPGDTFEYVGIDFPEEYEPSNRMAYVAPDGKTTVRMPDAMRIDVDRKILINHLIKEAEKAGVKLEFGKKIVAPVIKGAWVTGFVASDGENETEYTADLVIDACGMNSPLRRQLPSYFGIENEFDRQNIFDVYRIYFENKTGELTDPQYIVTFFNLDKPGIDWMNTNKDFVDIIVGKFEFSGDLTQKEIDEAIAKYKERFPYIGDKVLRGGTGVERIPISRMLPLIVGNGYAAVGDSAGMTVPLTGSGIALSMKAGKILADTVMAAQEKDLTVSRLWPYQYKYFCDFGKDYILLDLFKNFFTYIDSDDINYIMEKEILTADKMAVADGFPLKIEPEYLLHVLSVSMPLIPMVPDLLKSFRMLPLMPVVVKTIPEKYDAQKVHSWMKLYKAL